MSAHHDVTVPNASAETNRRAIRRVLVLALVLLALRIPWLNHARPIHLDEAHYVEAVGFPANYPVHYPGYPLWVALGTLLTWAGLDAYTAYQAWSVLASIAAPVLFYLGIRRWLDDTLAWWLALCLGLNPLIWFLATTALNYVVELAIGLLVVGMCWRTFQNRRDRDLKQTAGVLAIATLLRPDLLVWLGPLVGYVGWRHTRRAQGASAVIVATGLVLNMALIAFLYGRSATSGPHPTLSGTFHVVMNTSVFRLGPIDGLLRNLIKLCLNIAWDFGLSAVLLVMALVGVKRWSLRIPGAMMFLLLWVGPLCGFVLLIHMSEPGHVILLVPAGYVLMGVYLQNRFRHGWAGRLAAGVALCSLLQFTLYPWPSERPGFKRLLDGTVAYQSAAGLRQIEKRWEIHQPGDFWPTAAHTPMKK